MQTIGAYLINHQLHNLNGLYGQFALVLAILFWIALQAQVFMYAAEVNTVRAFKVYPRSITGNPLTEADKKALTLHARKEVYRPEPQEEVEVEFDTDRQRTRL